MRKILYMLFIFCFISIITLSGCSNHMISVVGTIIAKYDRQEYDYGESWFWEQPIYKTRYYFIVQYDNKTYKQVVDSDIYYIYDIGDEYVISIKNEALIIDCDIVRLEVS